MIGRLADWILKRGRPGRDIAFATVDLDKNNFAVFSHGDQIEFAHGRADMIAFTVQARTALQLARWLIIRYWVAGTWCGLKRRAFEWAMNRRAGGRSRWRLDRK